MAAPPREALCDRDVGRLGMRPSLDRRVLGNAGERHPTTTSGSGEGSSRDDTYEPIQVVTGAKLLTRAAPNALRLLGLLRLASNLLAAVTTLDPQRRSSFCARTTMA